MLDIFDRGVKIISPGSYAVAHNSLEILVEKHDMRNGANLEDEIKTDGHSEILIPPPPPCSGEVCVIYTHPSGLQ